MLSMAIAIALVLNDVFVGENQCTESSWTQKRHYELGCVMNMVLNTMIVVVKRLEATTPSIYPCLLAV